MDAILTSRRWEVWESHGKPSIFIENSWIFMKNDGFSLFSRLPSFGWEVLHPPPKVMCEDMHNQYLRSRAQLGGWPNSLGTRENSIMVRHHGRASSARSRKVSRGHGYLPRAGKRVAAAQRKGPDFLNHIRGSSHDKCQEQTFEGVNRTFFQVPKKHKQPLPENSTLSHREKNGRGASDDHLLGGPW